MPTLVDFEVSEAYFLEIKIGMAFCLKIKEKNVKFILLLKNTKGHSYFQQKTCYSI